MNRPLRYRGMQAPVGLLFRRTTPGKHPDLPATAILAVELPVLRRNEPGFTVFSALPYRFLRIKIAGTIAAIRAARPTR